MARKLLSEEIEARNLITRLLEGDELVSNYKTYLTPAMVVNIMAVKGIKVSRDFIVDRYAEKNIINRNGIWILDK